MTLSQLKERLQSEGIKITDDTIWFYIKNGLIPEPEKSSKNRAVYGETHYEYIKFIRFMKDKLERPLEEIKAMITPDIVRMFIKATTSDEEYEEFSNRIWEKTKSLKLKISNELFDINEKISDFSEEGYSSDEIVKMIYSDLIDINLSKSDIEEAIKRVNSLTKNESTQDLELTDYYLYKAAAFYAHARDIAGIYDDDVEFGTKISDYKGAKREYATLFSVAQKLIDITTGNPFAVLLINAILLSKAYKDKDDGLTDKRPLVLTEINDINKITS